jgi:predicted membrane-bound mannosyltransferase
MMDKPLQFPTREEWQLGGETEELRHDVQPPTPTPRDPSAARLERPLQVVTVEHLAWILIAAWALLSRLAVLGARPLTAAEAGPALFAYDLAYRANEAGAAGGLHPSWPGWIKFAVAGLFTAFGASDFTARIAFSLFGLTLIAIAFAMRPYVGRAGAIGVGAMLAVSPTVAWFSRTATSEIVVAALTLATLALFMTLKARPSAGRTSALGIASGLMISAGPTGLASAAMLVAALAILGLFALVTTRHAYLHARVWLVRYGGLALTAILLAAAICVLSGALSGALRDDLHKVLTSLWALRTSHFDAPVRALIIPLGFYEFLIAIAATAGFFAVISLRARSGFAFFTAMWTALSIVFYLGAPAHQPDETLMIILPAAILGGVAIEYFHHMRQWRVPRAVLVTIAILTIYVQSLTNFVYYAPDAADAPWDRRGSLYWSEGATTIQTADVCNSILKRIAPANVTVYHDGEWPPALRWYLRLARPVASVDAATIVVETDLSGEALPDSSAVSRFEYEESWSPTLGSLNWRRALAYLISQKIWGTMIFRSALVRTTQPMIPQSGSPPPTMILPPSSP